MKERRPKRDLTSLTVGLAAGVCLFLVALGGGLLIVTGLANASPVTVGEGQEGSDIQSDVYTVAIIQNEGESAHGDGRSFGAALIEALKGESIQGRLETPQGFLEALRSGFSAYRGAIVSPGLVVSPELARGLESFARLGGDLALLGEAGIALARVDTGAGLPVFSPHEPYELYELRNVVSVEPTGLFEELGFGEPDGRWRDAGRDGAGAIQGHSAVGYVYPFASRYWPLLSAHDEHGRTRGWAAGVLVHRAGPYSNGHWLISGVTTPSFYLEEPFLRLAARAFALFRSRELIERVAAEHREKHLARELFRVETPAPPGGIRVSDDGTALVTATGEPFFMIGANYAGPFGYGFGFGEIDVEAIEADFRKARWAGINVFRLWSAAEAGPKLKSVLSEMARKYGIYLLIVLPHPAEMASDEQYLARIRRIVNTWADEPMVIGYDLANEPDIQRIGGIRYGGEPAPVLALKPFETFQLWIDRRQIEEEVRSNAYPGNPRYTRHEENLHLRAARDLWLGLVAGPLTRRGRDYSTFPGYAGSLEPPAALAPLHDAVEATFAGWIGTLAAAIRELAPHQLITVGYDQPYALLAANEALDFVSHHVYQRPTALPEVEKNLTTLDRLRLRWPRKPVTLGEFGYSGGYPMPDGGMLDPYTAAVGEIMFYLDGFAKGYSGAMIWLLNERPIANMRYNEPWMQAPDLRYEERLGVFHYDGDGSLAGKPKPVAHAVRFFARWADGRAPGEGEFLLKRSGTRIGAGYVFQADDALFVGDVAYDGPGLSFAGEKAANVMLRWDDERLELMATADVTVRVDPSSFVTALAAGAAGGRVIDARTAESAPGPGNGTASTDAGGPGMPGVPAVRGNHGGVRREGAVLVIDLLEGEVVTIGM